jgi:hypothetical protein
MLFFSTPLPFSWAGWLSSIHSVRYTKSGGSRRNLREKNIEAVEYMVGGLAEKEKFYYGEASTTGSKEATHG